MLHTIHHVPGEPRVSRLMDSSRVAGAIGAAAFLFFPLFHRHVTVRLPLCPKIAAASYSNPAMPDALVNKYAADQAAVRKITIKPLSTFVAEVSGRKSRVKWFTQNYAFLICAFDSAQVTNDQSVYTTCTSNAPMWIEIIKSKKPEELMLGTHFAEVCAQ